MHHEAMLIDDLDYNVFDHLCTEATSAECLIQPLRSERNDEQYRGSALDIASRSNPLDSIHNARPFKSSIRIAG